MFPGSCPPQFIIQSLVVFRWNSPNPRDGEHGTLGTKYVKLGNMESWEHRIICHVTIICHIHLGITVMTLYFYSVPHTLSCCCKYSLMCLNPQLNIVPGKWHLLDATLPNCFRMISTVCSGPVLQDVCLLYEHMGLGLRAKEGIRCVNNNKDMEYCPPEP